MKLYLGSHYSFFLPHFPREVDIELIKSVRVSEVLTNLGIPMGEVYLVVVNDEIVDPQVKFVSQNDEVSLYPPVAGG
jgi:molybdopterin converting factor small subunit